MRDPAAIKAMIETANADFGKIDILTTMRGCSTAPRRIFSVGRLERHVCRQCHVGDVNDANGIAANARARLGSHHKYRLGQRPRVSEYWVTPHPNMPSWV